MENCSTDAANETILPYSLCPYLTQPYKHYKTTSSYFSVKKIICMIDMKNIKFVYIQVILIY